MQSKRKEGRLWRKLEGSYAGGKMGLDLLRKFVNHFKFLRHALIPHEFFITQQGHIESFNLAELNDGPSQVN